MTPAQLTTLKAAIAADVTANAFPNTDDGNRDLAAYLNTVPGSPTNLWKPSIASSELNTAVDWAAFAALSAAKQNTYLAITQGGLLDATSSGVRTGFAVVFGNPSATLTALTALAQRGATRFEAVFAVSNVCPVYGQSVSSYEVAAARNS